MLTLPQWVIEQIRRLPEKYTGQIRINCLNGGVRALEWGHRVEPTDPVLMVKTQQ